MNTYDLTTMTYSDYLNLLADLEKYAAAYYNDDEELISNEQYDALFDIARAYEAEHPEEKVKDAITNRDSIAGVANSKFQNVKHNVPMLSIDNSMNEETAMKFHSDVVAVCGQDVEYEAELKYDGLSINLVYVEGKFTQAITRGDGEIGEDVTHSVKHVLDIPMQISDTRELLEVRGEIMMRKSVLAEMQEQAKQNGTKPLANVRNAAAGGVRTLNEETTKQRKLFFRAYGVGKTVPAIKTETETQAGLLAYLVGLGFKIENTWVGKGFEFIQKVFEEVISIRQTLDFEIDGVVFKVNDFSKQNQMGWRSRVPNWATAYKFPAEVVKTKLLAIDIQIGKTGQATPVARVAPVYVGGVTVSNVTLNNINMIRQKNVRIGDTVLIRRAGEVIPEIIGVDLNERPSDSQEYHMPETCPYCQSELLREEDQVHYFCQGDIACEPQRVFKLAHFAGRTALDIDEMGEKTVVMLHQQGMLNNFVDMFNLDFDKIATMEGMGKSSTTKLKKAIEAAKEVELNRFIYALSIPNVGQNGSKILANTFGTLEAIMAADYESLVALNDVGPITASSIVSYITKQREMLEQLNSILTIKPVTKLSAVLEGKTFVITGTLSQSRDVIKAFIEANGGKTSGSVSKKTTYLVAGENAGDKLEKAKALGVTIISEDELASMINV